MQRFLTTLVPIVLVLFITILMGCDFGDEDVNGSGNVINQSRDVRDFTAVSLSGIGRLIIAQTGTESLTIEADDNILPFLISEVRGNQLTLRSQENTRLQTTKTIIYRLSVKSLNEIEVSGSAEVDGDAIDTDRLKVVASGSTEIALSGRASNQEITISGSGDYQAENLDSKTVMVTISGSGSVVVKATDRLDVRVSGSGSVEYIGNPAVTQEVSGSGSVRQR